MTGQQRAVLADAFSVASRIEAAEPVAVVGTPYRFPDGVVGPERYWDFLVIGGDAISEVPADSWDADAFDDPDPLAPGRMPSKWGGFLPDVADFDADFSDVRCARPACREPNGKDVVMPLIESSIPAVLEDRAQQQPDDIAYTFIDYEVDPAGFAESLTWSQVHQRAQVVAEKLLSCGSPGERAAILAPQSLEYVVAFLGAIQAGFIAVPLSVPQFGTHDERVSGVLRDCSPVAVLTTSAVVDDIRKYAQAQPRARAPRMIEIDALDFDSPRPPAANVGSLPKTAYLQYTSGSTRAPAGVVVTHKNVLVNLEQLMTDFFEDQGNFPPPDTTVVSWLPLYHDMGLVFGVFMPLLAGRPAVLMSPVSFMQKPARWMQLLASSGGSFTAAPNFAFELAVQRTSDDDMAGLDLGDVRVIINGAERVHAATIRRFTERFSKFNLPDTALRPSYGLAEATLYASTSASGQPPAAVRFDYEKLAAGHAKRCGTEGGSEMVSCGPPRSTMLRIVDPETADRESGRQGGGDLDARRQRRHGLLAQSAAERANLRWTAGRSVAGHAARAVAAHRGPGSDVGG